MANQRTGPFQGWSLIHGTLPQVIQAAPLLDVPNGPPLFSEGASYVDFLPLAILFFRLMVLLVAVLNFYCFIVLLLQAGLIFL